MKKEYVISIVVGSVVWAAVVGFFISRHSKKGDEGSLENLQKIADVYAKGLPMMVDAETQLEAVGAADHMIIYSYRLIHMDNADSTLKGKLVAMKPGMVNHNCSTPETRDNLLNKGISMKYDYYDSSKVYIVGIEMKQADCQ